MLTSGKGVEVKKFPTLLATVFVVTHWGGLAIAEPNSGINRNIEKNGNWEVFSGQGGVRTQGGRVYVGSRNGMAVRNGGVPDAAVENSPVVSNQEINGETYTRKEPPGVFND